MSFLSTLLIASMCRITCKIAEDDKEIRMKELERIRKKEEYTKRRQIRFKQTVEAVEHTETCTTTNPTHKHRLTVEVIEIDKKDSLSNMDPSITSAENMITPATGTMSETEFDDIDLDNLNEDGCDDAGDGADTPSAPSPRNTISLTLTTN